MHVCHQSGSELLEVAVLEVEAHAAQAREKAGGTHEDVRYIMYMFSKQAKFCSGKACNKGDD